MVQPTQERPLGEEILSTLGWEASEPFVGRWRKLISTTNWEKGRIIFDWRSALQAAGAPAAEYSDEAWSRLAGGITSQHVGRLRRVHERFADVHQNYEGLYWSHFFAALEWDDGEMWLEGAVQSSWSVSQMRRQRWETFSKIRPEAEPDDGEIVASELDEDAELDDADGSGAGNDGAHATGPSETESIGPSESVQRVRNAAAGDASDAEEADDEDGRGAHHRSLHTADSADAPAAPVRPFADLAELPEDITEAFETFKLAILRHKMDGWREVARDDVLASLDALKELTKS